MTIPGDILNRPSAVEALKELQKVRREYEAAKQALDQATRALVAVERMAALIEWMKEEEKKGE